jgi:hypothetical protein
MFKRILLMNLIVNNKINPTSIIINNNNNSRNDLMKNSNNTNNNNIKNLFNNNSANNFDNKKTIFTPFNATIYSNNYNNEQSNRSIRYLNSNSNNFEKCCILRIKCKCIQILNRLICLVSIFFSY